TRSRHDNSPTKNDTKDARVIAQMINDGRYSVPNIPEGNYAELREGVKLREQLSDQLTRVSGRIQNLIQRYFPEFFDVFGNWEGKAAQCTLRQFPFPSDIKDMNPEDVLATWKPYVKRGVGIKKATRLVETAQKSVGIQTGVRISKQELRYFLDQYQLYCEQLQELDQQMEQLLANMPGSQEMLAVKGLGIATVATFFAEVGDISQYTHPQQLVKLAGLSLKEHSSGQFKGQTTITKRGRKRLRKAIYLAVRPM